MPTIFREAGYRFYFYSAEPGEPPHVHVEHSGRVAKYWLDPVELAKSEGFRANELGKVRDLVLSHLGELQRSWNEYHGTPDEASPS